MPAARQHIHPLGLVALAVALLAAVAPMLVVATPARAASHGIAVLDGSFSPATLTITAGDTVTWTNQDDSPHAVTAGNGAFDSGNLDPGASFSFTFTGPGTYTYVCNYHDEMRATIVVEAASAAPAAQPQAPAASQPASTATGNSAAASHAQGHAGTQPDTALPTPDELAGWLAPMLIGLGLVGLAFGLVPMARPQPRAVPTRSPGWRR